MATKELRALTIRIATCLGIGAIQFLYRLRQCALYGPATLKSLMKRLLRQASLISPRGHTLCAPSVFNKPVGSRVPTLLSWRCPATVVRFVVAIFVRVSVKCCVGWSWPHVLHECFERITPPITNCYSATAVVAVFVIGSSVASADHSIPAFIFSRTGHAVSGEGSLCGASTASLRFVSADLRSWHGAFVSARAPAKPFTLRSRRFFNEPNDNPCCTKGYACQVFEIVWSANKISLSHVTVPQLLDVVRMARQLQLFGRSHFSSLAIRGLR